MKNLKQSVHILIAARIRARLQRHPIEGDRAAWLAQALSLSRPQIFRKLKGISPWSIDEIILIAQIFDCSPVEFLQDLLPEADAREIHHGLIAIDSVLVRCAFQIGEPGTGLFAIPGNHTWRLVATHPQLESAQPVRKAEILGLADRPRPLVLLIDDNLTLANTLCHTLERFGYSAIAITSTSAFAEKLNRFAYIDAFVLDRSTAKRTDEDLVSIACSSRHSSAAVIVLVSEEDDTDIATLNAGVRVLALPKPVAVPALVGALDSLLNRPPN